MGLYVLLDTLVVGSVLMTLISKRCLVGMPKAATLGTHIQISLAYQIQFSMHAEIPITTAPIGTCLTRYTFRNSSQLGSCCHCLRLATHWCSAVLHRIPAFSFEAVTRCTAPVTTGC